MNGLQMQVKCGQLTDLLILYFLFLSKALPNIDLPLPTEKVISINYDSITEENLDDWFAQSINRSLGSMLNPQKKFILPVLTQSNIARLRIITKAKIQEK
jgi:hypothetical protein